MSGKDGNLLHRFDGGLACTRLGDVDSDGRSDFAIAYFGRVTSTLRWRPWVASIVVYSGRSGAPAFEILGDSSGRECDLDLDGGNEFDGDGSPDLLVGSHKYNWGSKPSGRVRVDSGRSGNLLSNFDRSSMPERRAFEDDSFGEIVRWSSDLNGDGVPEILVGAPEDGAFEGTAYVLSGRDGKPLHTIEGHCGVLVPGEPDRGDRHVGRTLSRAGDLDRDGVEDFLVGNHPYDLGQFGLVRAFSGASGCLLWSIDRDAVLRSNAKAVSAR
ncbi:MAG TPA: FG-GAP repeat protein [Planctomycetota bacterium]|nr:FG-GAP repeat protein [Planctomycetota bacterium]